MTQQEWKPPGWDTERDTGTARIPQQDPCRGIGDLGDLARLLTRTGLAT